jgi:hypothetical protein
MTARPTGHHTVTARIRGPLQERAIDAGYDAARAALAALLL